MERTEETFWKELNKRISEAKEGDIIIADEPTYLLEKGVELIYIQKALGHSDMVTTQIYAHVSNPELRKRIDDAFGVKSEVQKTLSKSKRQVQNVGYMPNQLTLAQASDPLQILKLRLVSGEITIDRYNKLKRILLN